jgi:death-on-curing protein
VRDSHVLLTVEHVLLIHDEMLRRYGGSSLPGHRGELEGATAAVLAVENSYYEDVFELAAAYAVYIVIGHVFSDGNKRTGSAAALVFLHLNGIEIGCTPAELLNRMLELQQRAAATPPPSPSDLVSWFARWLEGR